MWRPAGKPRAIVYLTKQAAMDDGGQGVTEEQYNAAVMDGWRDLSLALGWGVSLADYKASVEVVFSALKTRFPSSGQVIEKIDS